MASTTVQTIAEQVAANGIRAKALIALSDTALRVHTKAGRTVKNMDITYDSRLDLYDVKIHIFSGTAENLRRKEYTRVYADMLGQLFELAK